MSETANKIKRNLCIIIILTLCLSLFTCTATFAANEENFKIILNEGKPIVDEENNYKPGSTIERNFTIENKADKTATYVLYFDEIEGNLKDKIEVTILDGEKTIMHGLMSELTDKNDKTAVSLLEPYEKRTLTAQFYFRKTGGNNLQNRSVMFDLKARANWSTD